MKDCCANCHHGKSLAPSVSATVSMCEDVCRLLPIYMDETRGRPEWCAGFEPREGVQEEKIVETITEQTQEELAL